MNKKNKKGFTLAELLIVVAIIGVLVAISIPIFTKQLRKAKLATNQANARAAYASAVAEFLSSGAPKSAATGMPENEICYEYDIETTKCVENTTYTGGWATGDGGIESWKVNDKVDDVVLGDTVASKWYVILGSTEGLLFGAEE